VFGIADWIILAVILASVVGAINEGFFQEAFGIAGLIVGYLLAAWQYHRLAAVLDPYVKLPWVAEIIGFLAIFFLVLLIAGLVGKLARWTVDKAGLSSVDRVLGGALGLLRGALVVAIVLVGMAAFNPTAPWLKKSQLAPYFLVVGRAATWMAPTELRLRFQQGLDYLRHHGGEEPAGNPAPTETLQH
jgi:membrane protein required for colicin V production